MTISNRRTPCVGICSTTYGDLVCRGCKRFAHEIVQWNGYDETQKSAIWDRLHALRDEVVLQQVSVVDDARFAATCMSAQLHDLAGAKLIYAVVTHLVVHASPDVVSAGLSAVGDGPQDAMSVMQRLDAEIYTRSRAYYEHSFKISV